MDESVRQKIDRFFSVYPERHYPKGNVIVFADERSDSIFHIIDGQVRQYDISYRGDEVTLNILKPPAFFSVGWALNDSPNKFAYKAGTIVKVRVAPAKDVKKFLLENADIAVDLLTRLYRGLDGQLGRMSQLMVGTARSRIIHELIIESERSGIKNSDKIGSINLNLTETDLASRTALSRETVSREISKLRADKIVEISGGIIKINDLKKLSLKL